LLRQALILYQNLQTKHSLHPTGYGLHSWCTKFQTRISTTPI